MGFKTNKDDVRKKILSMRQIALSLILHLKITNPNFFWHSAIQESDNDDLFSRIIKQYITTKDSAWLHKVFSLSEKIGKKSNQSRVFAMIARDLIDAGVSDANQDFIDQGMIILDRISFRKYRSDIMIDIIPLLI